MRKISYLILLLFLAGALAYLAGYYYTVRSHDSATKQISPYTMEDGGRLEGTVGESENAPAKYIARIQGEWLMVLQMPEESVFEYVEASDLQLSDEVKAQLQNGISFQNEKEVYEFLENCMS